MANIRFDVRQLERILPSGMSDEHKDLLIQVAARGVAAANSGDDQVAEETADIFKTVYLDNNGDGTSPFESCGDHCQHHLDDGNAPAYATCYWACVMRGGPNATTISHTVAQRATAVLRSAGR